MVVPFWVFWGGGEGSQFVKQMPPIPEHFRGGGGGIVEMEGGGGKARRLVA